uniref:Beta-transducin repeat containing protein n=1 Tax=Mus spicilegus TaxID=10103 RepID=A0A8C6MV98_MUSSI
MDPAEAVLQEKALKFMAAVPAGGYWRNNKKCSMPRSLWLGCSSLADSMPSLRCLYNPGTGALTAFQKATEVRSSLERGRYTPSAPAPKSKLQRHLCEFKANLSASSRPARLHREIPSQTATNRITTTTTNGQTVMAHTQHSREEGGRSLS